MDSKRFVILILLIAILYFVSIQAVLRLIQGRWQHTKIISAVASVVFTALLLLLMTVVVTVGTKVDGFKLLEISPAKKCIGGPYMWGDVNSPTFKYCSDPKNQQAIRDASCCIGFVGMPVKYSYTPESDEQWKNPRCHIYGSGHVDGVGA